MTLMKPDDSMRRASRVSRSKLPTVKLEQAAWRSGYNVVAGADEVGRGAWAGPLVAAALIIPRDPVVRARLTRGLNRRALVPRDSKLLSPEAREQIVDVIDSIGIRYAIACIPPATVDSVGLGVANADALCAAVDGVGGVDFALIDHYRLPGMNCERRAVAAGDRVCLSIALASIVAKVHRDALMRELDRRFPGYGFGDNKGYGTRSHQAALDRLGVTEQHRRSFRPVAERLDRA